MEKNMLEEIKKILYAEYGFDQIDNIDCIREQPSIYNVKSHNNTYFVKINNIPFIKEKYNLSYRYLLIDKLIENKTQTPKIIKTNKNENYTIYNNSVFEVYEWCCFDKYSFSKKTFNSTIELLIKILNIFSSIKVPFPEEEKKQVWKDLNNDNIEWERVNYLCEKHFPNKKILIDKLNTFLDENEDICKREILASRFQYIHNDFNLKNIGYIKNSAKIIMDFEAAKPGYALQDIAMCYFELCFKDIINTDEREKRIRTFLDIIQNLPGIDFKVSERALLFIICKRLLRHIYKGAKDLEDGNELFCDFNSIFIYGLESIYKYLSEKDEIKSSKSVTNSEKNLFDLIIEISKDKFDTKYLPVFSTWVKDKELFHILFRTCCKNKILSNLYTHLINLNLLNSISSYYKVLFNCSISFEKEKNELFHKEFIKLNKQFIKHDINYVCIKGLAIGERYFYKNSNILRSYNDMDFLVELNDISKVEEILNNNKYLRGFYAYEDSSFLPATRQELIHYKINSHQVYPFSKPMENFRFSPANLYKIDLNFSIFFGGKIKDEIPTHILLENKEIVEIDLENKFPVLSPEKETIQISYAFYKDTIYKKKKNGLSFVLSGLRDIFLIIENRKPDFNKLEQLLKNTSIASPIYKIIAFVNYCYEGSVTSELVKKLNVTLSNEEINNLIQGVLNN